MKRWLARLVLASSLFLPLGALGAVDSGYASAVAVPHTARSLARDKAGLPADGPALAKAGLSTGGDVLGRLAVGLVSVATLVAVSPASAGAAAVAIALLGALLLIGAAALAAGPAAGPRAAGSADLLGVPPQAAPVGSASSRRPPGRGPPFGC